MIKDLSDSPLFEEYLERYGPCLSHAKIDLRQAYRVLLHETSGATVIMTRPTAIPSRAPFSDIPYEVRHIACCVVHEKIGVEVVNAGLVGNVDEGEVLVRMESFCPPAFVFGSQKCSCADQWAVAREIAGRRNGGTVLLHLDTQAGMGAGVTPEKFAPDLYARAVMRQMGESALGLSIQEGYDALGVPLDGRAENGGFGYEVPAIVLLCLGVSADIALMTNNPQKIAGFSRNGFSVRRVKLIGKMTEEGFAHAKEKRELFGHLDMEEELVTVEDEVTRLAES